MVTRDPAVYLVATRPVEFEYARLPDRESLSPETDADRG